METQKQGFKKATKEQAKLRCAMFGTAGSGKTYSALGIGTGILSVTGGRMAVIDSERGTASKYSDRFDFDVINLDNTKIDTYIEWINQAQAAGYKVLVIDSLSHAWTALLAEIDELAKTKFNGNSMMAWRVGTPRQLRFIDAILKFDGHIIATMRVQTDYEYSKDEKGRTKVEAVGTSARQGKDIEYEFDFLIRFSREDHLATIEKDRSGKFQDKVIDRPGAEFGREIALWLAEGAKPEEKPAAAATGTQGGAKQGTGEPVGDDKGQGKGKAGAAKTGAQTGTQGQKTGAPAGEAEKKARLMALLQQANPAPAKGASQAELEYYGNTCRGILTTWASSSKVNYTTMAELTGADLDGVLAAAEAVAAAVAAEEKHPF